MDLKKTAQNLIDREAARKEEILQERSRALDLLVGASGIFGKYGIDRVWVYGSVTGDDFHAHSDIDIAVEGDISFKEVLGLHSELSVILQRTVDVRLIDDLPFINAVKEKGTIIYERKDIHS